MSANRGGDVTFRLPEDSGLGAECRSLSCELAGTATEPGVVTAVVLAGLLAFVAFAYVRDAKSCCRQERRRVLDERDAFEEFADRVSGLDPSPVNATGSAFTGPVVGAQRTGSIGGPGDVRVRNVLDSYRNTVMSLPHYREEYDEGIAESLAAELGPDTTTSLASNGTLSPGLQSALVDRSRRAARARSSLADAIDTELDELTDAETTLTEIDRQRSNLNEHLEGVAHGRTDAAIDVWERLGDLEERCEAVATDRQASLRDPPLALEERDVGDERTFSDYLYGPVDGPRHPVLASVASLAERIREDRDRVTRRIAGIETEWSRPSGALSSD